MTIGWFNARALEHLGLDPITYHGPTYGHACLTLATLERHPGSLGTLFNDMCTWSKAPRDASLAGAWLHGTRKSNAGRRDGGLVERFFGLLDWCFHTCAVQVVSMAADPLD